MTAKKPEFDHLREQASEHAREMVTLIKMAEEQSLANDAHIGGIVRERMKDYTQPRQAWALVEVLARGVAATYDDLDDWSTSVLQAISEEADDA